MNKETFDLLDTTSKRLLVVALILITVLVLVNLFPNLRDLLTIY
jgi:hypothetical protein